MVRRGLNLSQLRHSRALTHEHTVNTVCLNSSQICGKTKHGDGSQTVSLHLNSCICGRVFPGQASSSAPSCLSPSASLSDSLNSHTKRCQRYLHRHRRHWGHRGIVALGLPEHLVRRRCYASHATSLGSLPICPKDSRSKSWQRKSKQIPSRS